MSVHSQNKTLVAYFSWSGNIKIVAEYIRQATGADIIRIEPVKKYKTVSHYGHGFILA